MAKPASLTEPAQPRKLKRHLQSDTEPILKKPKTTHVVETVNRPAKDSIKPKVTISTAKILKRTPMKAVFPKPALRRRKRAEPEHDLFLDYKEDLEAYRKALRNEAVAGLSEAFEELTKELSEIELRDKEISDSIARQRDALLTPLTDEHVETSFTRNGKQVTETISIAERVEELKNLALKSQAELKSLWDEWEQIQNDIVELGIDVFGNESGKTEGGKGYALHVRAWDLELQQQNQEMQKEIESIGKEAVEKLTAAEKEIDATLKKQQANLFSRLFAED